MFTIKPVAPPALSNVEIALVLALLLAGILDDFLYVHYQPGITEFALIDWAKKTAVFFVCILPSGLRAISRQAFWAPSVPWGGEGWLNANVLTATAIFFLCDQAIHWIATAIFLGFEQGPLYAFPAYGEDIIKYLDLAFGLLWNSVVEELFFRPVLLAVLIRFIPHLGLRILIAGVLFGLGHWSQGAVWVVAFSFSGCLFAYLYCLTRSIIPGIVIHTLHNLMVFAP